ncbi:MAG: NAD(P)/FAD-dependent oxidoreductase [Anaerolinea sp.]|nr:NAD(P)/FAD-dependent oxidoreductase [Anaerolinea sp.]
MHDLIIVGGGPAGLTAAVYAIRKRLDVILVSQDLGGKINYTMSLPDMEPYQVIRGADIVEKFWQELDYLDFARRLESVTAVTQSNNTFTVHLADQTTLAARAIIYAAGVRVQRLDVPGERRFLGRGVSYSAISHAHLFIGKNVIIVGDGPRAHRAVAELLQTANQVHLVTPAGEAGKTLRELAANREKLTLWPGYRLLEIAGDDFVAQVTMQAPGGDVETLYIDGLFIELNLIPNTQPLASLVELNEQGRIIVNKLNHTSCPGLFAAGDITDICVEQVLVAVGEGAKAALSAYDYLLPAF